MEDHPGGTVEALAEHIQDPVVVLDVDGQVKYAGPDGARALGGDRPTLTGSDAFGRVHPEDRESIRSAFAELVDGAETSMTASVRTRGPDGDWVPAEFHVSDADAITGYVATMRRGEDAVERHRQAALDRMSDGFLVVDDDWRITYLNDRAADLVERPAESIRGRNLWEAFPDAVGTAFERQYRRAKTDDESVAFEATYAPLDTTYEVRAYPHDTGLSVYFRDVTDERRTEEQLRRNVEALRELYETTADAGLSFDEKQQRLLALGRDFLDLPYGFVTRLEDGTQTVVDALGDHPLLQPGEQCPIEQSYCRKTVESGGLLAVVDAVEEGWEGDPAHDTFELGCYVGGKVVVDGDLYGTLCFAASEPRGRTFSQGELTMVELMSKWLGYELEQQEYQSRLERKNDRLERFASVLSHDLRNPLVAARSAVELARRRHGERTELTEAEESLDRAFAVVDDVLAFAREGDGTVDAETVSLATVAENAWEVVPSGSAQLRVEDPGTVEGDPQRLQRLFENLFDNAVDHADPGVTVRVGSLPDGDGFFVEDDGPGIPEDERDEILEFGVTTTDAGSGLGLATVQMIAAAHDREVAVRESPEGGARFEFAALSGETELPAGE